MRRPLASRATDRVAFAVGDVVDVLRHVPDHHFDACLCDPPYGLGFLNEAWDAEVPSVDAWRAIARVLKPGAHVFACGGTRKFYDLASNMHRAGVLVRDTVAWLYGDGAPKSLKLPGGYGTGLRTSWEPIVLGRNRLPKGMRTRDAFDRYGTGGLNLSACTVKAGRWAPNATLDEAAARVLDDAVGDRPPTMNGSDGGGPSRFFYAPKASRAERDFGCDAFPLAGVGEAVKRKPGNKGTSNMRAGAGKLGGVRNTQPTLKPIALARWLAQMLLVPDRGVPRRILVPYAGAGSEVVGAVRAGWDHVFAIERDAKYAAFLEARVRAWSSVPVDLDERVVAKSLMRTVDHPRLFP